MPYRCSLQWISQNHQDKTSLKGAAEAKPAALHVFMLCTLGSVEAQIQLLCSRTNTCIGTTVCSAAGSGAFVRLPQQIVVQMETVTQQGNVEL